MASAARRIAREAAELDQAGKKQQAAKLLGMLTKLREITAELLVTEL